MRFERRKRFAPPIDIAPLVDVVFLLLLFFMLTSRMVSEPVIQVDLPESSTAQEQPPEVMVVSVTGQGSVYLDDEPVALADLASAVSARLADGTHPSVRVRADRAASVGVLIQVVDAVRQGGCSSFDIETRGAPRSAQPSPERAP